MIRLTCDNCEKPIDVADDAAGQKVKCPACGDVNVVPMAGKRTDAAPKVDRAAQAGYPAAAADEVTVMQVRRAMFRARPLSFLLLLAGVLGGGGGAVFSMFVATPSSPVIAIACGAVGLGCLGLLAYWRITAGGEALEITNKRTMGRTGILSRTTSDVMHRDIRNIQVRQSFAERLMGVGEICISSAAEDDHEILMKGIPKPNRVREIIDLYRT